MTYQETKENFRRLKLLITEFIRKATEFEGDEELAKLIGTEIGNLQFTIYENGLNRK